jgi:hypothetical protein
MPTKTRPPATTPAEKLTELHDRKRELLAEQRQCCSMSNAPSGNTSSSTAPSNSPRTERSHSVRKRPAKRTPPP